MDEIIRHNRDFLKSTWGLTKFVSDQQAGKPQPPLEKAVEPGELIALSKPDAAVLRQRDLHACLTGRRSRRAYSTAPLSLPELSYLLWVTQGVDQVIREGYATLRPAPSAGARHTFETYVLASRIADLKPGTYRYLPREHQLVQRSRWEDLPDGVIGVARQIACAASDQTFVSEAAAVFVWSCLPYRAEWRYGPRSHKNILLDAGHVCQNLYLACEAIGLSTCAIAAYRQQAFDELVGLDGYEEFVVYLAPVGRPTA